MDDLIDTVIQRNAATAIHGAVGAMADTQAKMISMLLLQGKITSFAAEQMITELRQMNYGNPPLNDAESVRRHLVTWIADHLQDHVEWNLATDQ